MSCTQHPIDLDATREGAPLEQSPFIFKKLPASYTREGWGILNPLGSLWSDEIFDTPELAQRYVTNFWRNSNTPEGFTDRFTYVEVTRQVNVSHRGEQFRLIIAKPAAEQPHD